MRRLSSCDESPALAWALALGDSCQFESLGFGMNGMVIAAGHLLTATEGEAVGVMVGRSSSEVVCDAVVRTSRVRADRRVCHLPEFVCTLAVGS
jgi:hypothetical protein